MRELESSKRGDREWGGGKVESEVLTNRSILVSGVILNQEKQNNFSAGVPSYWRPLHAKIHVVKSGWSGDGDGEERSR